MNAYKLRALADLGITLGDLGCIMLDVEAPIRVADIIPESWAYRSNNPDLRHVDGITTEHHVTLLFGLLPQVQREHVDEVLDGWDGLDVAVKTDMLEVFPSPLSEEPYSCIVARQTAPSREIRDAHARLSLLPHVNTHPEFKAHTTLAYVRRERTEEALNELRRAFGARDVYVPILFRPTALNYGDRIGERTS